MKKKYRSALTKPLKLMMGKTKWIWTSKTSKKATTGSYSSGPRNVAGVYSIRNHSLHTTLAESQPHCLTHSQQNWAGPTSPGTFWSRIHLGFTTNNTDVSWIISEGLEKLGVHICLQNQIPSSITHMNSSFVCFDFETGSSYIGQTGLKHNSFLDILELKF